MDLEPNEEDLPSDGDETGGPNRRSLVLIILVAAGFLLVGGLDVAAYWFKCRRQHLELSMGHCLYLSIPIAIGGVILVLSPALSRAIDEYLDE